MKPVYRFFYVYILPSLLASLLGALCSVATAQQFELKRLNIVPHSRDTTLIDVNDRGTILGQTSILNETGGRIEKTCFFTARENGANLNLICGDQLSEAFDINNNGVVVGASAPSPDSELPHGIATIWDRKHGARQIGFLNPEDTFSAALGINDSGEVVGFSGRSHLVLDADGAFLYAQYEIYPFLWDQRHGIRHAFDNTKRQGFAARIDNHGTIAGALGDTFNPEDYSDWPATKIVVKRKNKRTSRIPAINNYSNVVYTDPAEATQNLDLAGHNLLGAYRSVVDYSKRRVLNRATTLKEPRYDYGYVTKINTAGHIGGFQVGGTYLTTAAHGTVTVDCMFPHNRDLGGFFVSDLTFDSVARITNDDRIYFTADIDSINGGKTPFVLKPLKNAPAENHTNFCPLLTLDLGDECAGAFQPSDHHADAYAYQTSYVRQNAHCTGKVRALATGESYTGVPITVTEYDACGNKVGSSSRQLPANGRAAELSLFYDSSHRYDFSVGDPRFSDALVTTEFGDFSTSVEYTSKNCPF